jgi:antitoxin MazE
MPQINELKIVQIGNSKGIRIPKSMLQKYGFSDSIQIEERENGILLRNTKKTKLSWEDTFKSMKKEKENWGDFDSTLLDGLDED